MTKPECPQHFNIDFARKLIAYLGGDVSLIDDRDCWRQLAKKFPHLREKAEQYFAEATTGDPARAAYCMVLYCGSSRKWAKGVIERDKTGDPAYAAFGMAHYCGSSREWAEGVIERAATGGPAYAAYWMAEHCGSSRKWAEGVIERATTGNPAYAARLMALGFGSSEEWVNRIKRKWENIK